MKNEFMLGCNYWASHAGTEMWKDWSAETVKKDFEKLSQYGIKYLRVFPNWRDFQPINPLIGGGMVVRDYRLHDADLPQNPYYLDETMLERFGIFCDLAEEYGMKLIVGLLTGWMSGRIFIPSALYGKNLSSDTTALLFEQKFVHGMAERFKDKKSIYAWDLGNECNCLVTADSHETAENWSMIISNAIRTADNTRPIVSGMHSLGIEGIWRIADQAETTDILTTHPYPYWCSHCSESKITSVQTLMHATCETKYYSNIGSKPCLAEEIGTMGPMICNNEVSGNFMKLNLYSNWVNGALGVLWWCANEQSHLMFPPYEYSMCENELGMFDKNAQAKPVLNEVKNFSELIKTFNFELPPTVDDAVCLATAGQDQWGVIYSSYVLAKQAGVNIRFADACSEIPDADIYLMPSINGDYVMPKHNYHELIKRVQNGAVLYISANQAILSDFNFLTGLTLNDSSTKFNRGTFELNGSTINYSRNRNYIISANEAQTLAKDKNDMPIFTKHRLGKGTVYFLNFPLEFNAIGVSDAFDDEQHEIYNEIFKNVKQKYAINCDNKYIGLTRHSDTDCEWITMINYSPVSQKTNAVISSEYQPELIYGNIDNIEPFEMTIVKLTKNDI